jgi:hypothetical protein
MTNNLFPLPYWAPALRRVPIPLQVLNEAYLRGKRAGGWPLFETRPLLTKSARHTLHPSP